MLNHIYREKYQVAKPFRFHGKQEGSLSSTVMLCLFLVPTFLKYKNMAWL